MDGIVPEDGVETFCERDGENYFPLVSEGEGLVKGERESVEEALEFIERRWEGGLGLGL